MKNTSHLWSKTPDTNLSSWLFHLYFHILPSFKFFQTFERLIRSIHIQKYRKDCYLGIWEPVSNISLALCFTLKTEKPNNSWAFSFSYLSPVVIPHLHPPPSPLDCKTEGICPKTGCLLLRVSLNSCRLFPTWNHKNTDSQQRKTMGILLLLADPTTQCFLAHLFMHDHSKRFWYHN